MSEKVNQKLKNSLNAVNDQQEEHFYQNFYLRIGNTTLPDKILSRIKEMMLTGDDIGKIVGQLAAFSMSRFHIRVSDDIDASAKDAK